MKPDLKNKNKRKGSLKLKPKSKKMLSVGGASGSSSDKQEVFIVTNTGQITASQKEYEYECEGETGICKGEIIGRIDYSELKSFNDLNDFSRITELMKKKQPTEFENQIFVCIAFERPIYWDSKTNTFLDLDNPNNTIEIGTADVKFVPIKKENLSEIVFSEEIE